eukprot:c4268_g1_i1.p1 GENE.c4268_g1_i1~~c4268_g1_i1.p1  ORF type:complete len:165 (+),score=30.86 c4268_g1_i1:152-646(+)
MTVGAAFGSKNVDVRGSQITIGIWDTAGSERFESMSRVYYRGAGAAIVCFDLTQGDTWSKVEFWVRELQKFEPKCKIFVAGTKKDLIEKEVADYDINVVEVQAYCNSIGACGFFETSAKEGTNIVNLFDAVAQTYEPPNPGLTPPSISVAVRKPQQPTKTCCLG